MFKVRHQLGWVSVAGMLIVHGAACDESDIVLGARGGSLAGMEAMASDAGGQAAAPRPSTGCGSDPVSSDASLEVEGMLTRYIVDLPATYEKARAYPLVMSFRRSDTTAQAFRDSLGLPLAAGADAILVHPDCPDDASTWNVPADLQMVDALLAKLASSYCIDQGRVFAVGHGQGALLVNALGCARDALRGLAPLSAVLAPPEVCGGQAAVWLMQGSAEPSTMTYGHDNRDFWIERNGCDASMPMAAAPSPCVAYAGCDPGFPVRFCEYGPELELPSFTASAVWDFFRAL
jgi:poly(3-hydroxybutyrate) depolymerase